MGSSNTLKDFIKRSHNFYPDAERIILVLSNHGGAALGVCEDDSSDKDMLTMNELQNSLSYAKSLFNKKLDVLYFQACLMQQIEIDYVVGNYATQLIGSQTLYSGFQSYPSKVIIEIISQNPSIKLAELVHKTVYEDGTTIGETDDSVASFDLSFISRVTQEIEELSSLLIDNLNSLKEVLLNILNSEYLPYMASGPITGVYPYKDLRVFLNLLKNSLDKDGYPEIVNIILKLMDDLNNAIDAYISPYRTDIFQGVGIFLPAKSEDYDTRFLTNFELSGAPHWNSLIQKLLGIEG